MQMPKRIKKGSNDEFLAHKTKNDADFCNFMLLRNSDHDVNTLDFIEARLRHNKVCAL